MDEENIHIAIIHLQENMQVMTTWYENREIKLSPTKTAVLTVSRKIDLVETINVLGEIFHSGLCFDFHILYIVTKLHRTGFLIKTHLSEKCLQNVT